MVGCDVCSLIFPVRIDIVQCRDDGIDGLVVVQAGQGDGDVGPALVQWDAFGVEAFQVLAGFEDDAAGVQIA